MSKQKDTGKSKGAALEAAIADIDKAFGQGTIMRSNTVIKIPVISTGALNLDAALGAGGIPRGRITEVYGPEASGKTTICLHVIANAQREGGTAAIVDAEHALDLGYAEKLGVDIDSLLVSQPACGEEALSVVERLIQSGAVDVVVVDSVAALVPKAELEGEMGASHMGLQARMMGQAMRKLTGLVSRTNCALIFVNQLRERVGVIFGSPEVTTGGKALKFYASVRLDVRGKKLKADDEAVGTKVTVKVVKNKVGPPFREAQFDMLYGIGIDRAGILLNAGVDLGIIVKSGSWYEHGDTKLGQGSDNARAYLLEHPELMAEIEAEYWASHQAAVAEEEDE